MPQLFKDVATSFTNYLRRASKIQCPLEGCDDEFLSSDDRLGAHLRLRHKDLLEHRKISTLIQDIKSGNGNSLRGPERLTLRRGRGVRKNTAYWKERNNDSDASLFDEREVLFSNEHGALKVSRLANLDTQLKVNKGNGDDLIMSSHCARELGILEQISTDFEDPGLQSISGHATAVRGILRNVPFRLKGNSVTFHRSFWVCDAIDTVIDIMIGAKFIKDNFKMLFEKVEGCVSTFATWFSKKKETPEQKREREELERQQKIRVNEQEIKRLQRENEMHQRASQANSRGGGSAQSGAEASR